MYKRVKKLKIRALGVVMLFFLLGLSVQGFGQAGIPSGGCGIEYTYDAAGNMVLRQYICNNSARAVSPATSVSEAGKDNKNPETAEKMTSFQKVDILYPNPTTGKFSIKMVIPLQNTRVEIVNAQGAAILRRNMSGSILEFNLAGNPAGVYFIKIYDKSETFSAQVIIR